MRWWDTSGFEAVLKFADIGITTCAWRLYHLVCGFRVFDAVYRDVSGWSVILWCARLFKTRVLIDLTRISASLHHPAWLLDLLDEVAYSNTSVIIMCKWILPWSKTFWLQNSINAKSVKVMIFSRLQPLPTKPKNWFWSKIGQQKINPKKTGEYSDKKLSWLAYLHKVFFAKTTSNN